MRTADEFPFVEFVGADSRLFGIEAHADVDADATCSIAELTYDWVRGELTDSGRAAAAHSAVPRASPGLRYQKNALQVGGSVTGRGRSEPRLRRGNADRGLRRC